MTLLRHVVALFSFNGHIERLQFWLIIILTNIVLTPIHIHYGESVSQGTVTVIHSLIYIIVTLVAFWLIIAACKKRLNSRGRPTYWLFLLLIPMLGHIWLMVECGILGNKQAAKSD
ncbi:DUF805 domain-containing protein [Thalassotalea euphylliae]|uniref:DUF805 domain-containing protein n=1 Tax=Thalassotalea euphylliae TaxID=1655234 RepID=UPI00362EDF01